MGDPVYSGGVLTHIPPLLQPSNGYYQLSQFSNPEGVLLNGMLQSTNHSFGPIVYQTPPGFYPPGVISISPTILKQQQEELLSSQSSKIVDMHTTTSSLSSPTEINPTTKPAQDIESISV